MEIFDSMVTLVICFQCKSGFLNQGKQNQLMFCVSEEEKIEDREDCGGGGGI